MSEQTRPLIPGKGRVLVELIKGKEKTAGGIYLPPDATKKGAGPAVRGKVLATGEGVKPIDVGDEIIFEQYAGTEIVLDEKKYTVVEQDEVLAFAPGAVPA